MTGAFEHVSVMLHECVAALAPRDGAVLVDCTLGGGGHSEALLEAADCRVIGLDRDPAALAAARARLARFGDRFVAVHAPFAQVRSALDDLGIDRVDGLLADLGVSSHQLDTADRGFSFRAAGPVDMRMDPTRGRTAAELIDALSEAELADLIYAWGEDRLSRRIARAIVAGRPWSDTLALARAIENAVPPRLRGRIHPATRTFQALRIAVNDELSELQALLDASIDLLRIGGRVAILSFHSLEDRMVKEFLSAHSGRTAPKDPWGNPVGPVHLAMLPPQKPHPDDPNPRARSARLRVAERLPWNER